MSRVDRARLERLFLEAMDLEGGDRAAFVERACGADPELRTELEALLKEDESGTKGLLATPASALLDNAGAAEEREPVPARLGAFTIVRVLGEGGMGRVYEAEQDSPRRTVALKVIRPGVMSKSALRRFELEAQVLAGLKHPGIAQVYETGSVGSPVDAGGSSRPYFAMELVRGPSLVEYARQRGLGTRERLALLAKVADAVQHAHQRGVIHRDLKPANILVEDAPEGPADETATGAGTSAQPKILDFGIARLAERGEASASMRTEAGALVGTLAYMSPEQVDADPAKIDTRCDVYALGVIGYELLAGRAPIDVGGRSIYEAARLVKEAEPAPLGRLDKAWRGDVETIIAKAMEKDPARRYATAAELAADIRRYLHDEPIGARPASTWYQARKFARRNRALAGAGVIAATALLVGSGLLAVGLIKARRSEAEAEARARSEAAQRAAADRRFGQVRELAKTLLFKVNDEVEHLEGSTAARRTIVQTGMRYLDALAAEAKGDDELGRELALGYLRLADILGDPAGSNLGDTPGAMESARKAIAILEPLLERDEPGGRMHAALSDAYQSLGNLQRVTGGVAEAIVSHTRALELARVTAAAHPEDVLKSDDFVVADATLGRMKEQMGDRLGAIEHYERARRYFLRRLETSGQTQAGHSAVVMALKIGEALLDLRQTSKAEQVLREGLATCRGLRQKHGSDARFRSSEVSLNFALGRAMMDAGCREEARGVLEGAVEMQMAACERDPLDVRARRNLGVAYYWLARAYTELGLENLSLLANTRFRDNAADLLSGNPSNSVMRHDYAVGEAYVGDAYRRLGRFDDAIAAYERGFRVMGDLWWMEPDDATHGGGVVEQLNQLTAVRMLLAETLRKDSDERRFLLRQAEGEMVFARLVAKALQARGGMTPGFADDARMIEANWQELRQLLDRP